MTDYKLSPPPELDLEAHFIKMIEHAIGRKSDSSTIVSVNFASFINHPKAVAVLTALAEEYKAIGWTETEDLILEVEDSVRKGQMNSALKLKLKYIVSIA